MHHFATESGKSKGQFYTPAEVSRIMAKIVGIRDAATTTSTTVYDPNLRLRLPAPQSRR
jgi:type I restriction enzyme M protein